MESVVDRAWLIRRRDHHNRTFAAARNDEARTEALARASEVEAIAIALGVDLSEPPPSGEQG